VSAVAGKRVEIRPVPGPVGVMSRNFSNDRIYSIGWRSQVDLRAGIERPIRGLEQQVKANSAGV